MKRCSKCKKLKSRKAFVKDKGRKDRLYPICRLCSRLYREEYFRNPKNREKQRLQGKEEIIRRKLEVLRHYSKSDTPFCRCCGIRDLEFLSIDHINGGGGKHRRSIGIKDGSGIHLYRWLKKNNYPLGFRVLCHNCNQSLGAYGYCPHATKRRARDSR